MTEQLDALVKHIEDGMAGLEWADKRIKELEAAQAWQPIEHSPRDGSAFLVWWPLWYHFPLIAYWKDYQLRLPDSTQPAPPWSLDWPDGPTHWMPLPAPPETG